MKSHALFAVLTISCGDAFTAFEHGALPQEGGVVEDGPRFVRKPPSSGGSGGSGGAGSGGIAHTGGRSVSTGGRAESDAAPEDAAGDAQAPTIDAGRDATADTALTASGGRGSGGVPSTGGAATGGASSGGAPTSGGSPGTGGAICRPKNCGEQGIECGGGTDLCGKSLFCGSCTALSCSSGHCVCVANQCPGCLGIPCCVNQGKCGCSLIPGGACS